MPLARRHHVVPGGYLKHWTVDDKLRVTSVANGDCFQTGVNNAGVRSDFYLREDADGGLTDDVERALGAGPENAGLPLLEGLTERWPLSHSEKVVFAQLLGTQLVRGERWRAYQRRFVLKALPATRREIVSELAAAGWRTPDGTQTSEEEVAAQFERSAPEMVGRTEELRRMLGSIANVSSVLACMHWTLLVFPESTLLTSDEPIVAWPLGVSTSTPDRLPGWQGLVDGMEVRVPCSPTSAILMTWLEARDARPVKAFESIARNINAFTAAQANAHWFSQPGTEPGRGRGLLPPIAPMLLSHYDDAAARSSRRRQATSAAIEPNIGLGENAELTVVRPVASPPKRPQRR